MSKLKFVMAVSMATLLFTGCNQPEPKDNIGEASSITLSEAQLKDVTTEGKDLEIVSSQKLDTVIWRVIKKPEGSHPAFLNSHKKSDGKVYYKFFKPDRTGVYTIKVEAKARGKVDTKVADINVIR
ncbi:MAG: hypothetical protein GXO60_08780 [Epsilonproteobacteria bacterium]|nr:hypothetical protein [Campylobacterota bacterium]